MLDIEFTHFYSAQIIDPKPLAVTNSSGSFVTVNQKFAALVAEFLNSIEEDMSTEAPPFLKVEETSPR